MISRKQKGAPLLFVAHLRYEKVRRTFLFFFALFFGVVACAQPNAVSKSGPTKSAEKPSVIFSKKTLRFDNSAKLEVEVALTPEQKAQGLMFREHLAEGQGMIFFFPVEQTMSFWMKNTLIPLSIGFFDKNKKLIEIFDMAPGLGPVVESQLPRYVSTRPGMFAIEVPKGWFAKNKIKPGAVFTILP